MYEEILEIQRTSLLISCGQNWCLQTQTQDWLLSQWQIWLLCTSACLKVRGFLCRLLQHKSMSLITFYFCLIITTEDNALPLYPAILMVINVEMIRNLQWCFSPSRGVHKAMAEIFFVLLFCETVKIDNLIGGNIDGVSALQPQTGCVQ